MLSPKRTTYRNVMRGTNKGRTKRGGTVAFGEYGLQALEAVWLVDVSLVAEETEGDKAEVSIDRLARPIEVRRVAQFLVLVVDSRVRIDEVATNTETEVANHSVVVSAELETLARCLTIVSVRSGQTVDSTILAGAVDPEVLILLHEEVDREVESVDKTSVETDIVLISVLVDRVGQGKDRARMESDQDFF